MKTTFSGLNFCNCYTILGDEAAFTQLAFPSSIKNHTMRKQQCMYHAKQASAVGGRLLNVR